LRDEAGIHDCLNFTHNSEIIEEKIFYQKDTFSQMVDDRPVKIDYHEFNSVVS
jgi:hypothetical protein